MNPVSRFIAEIPEELLEDVQKEQKRKVAPGGLSKSAKPRTRPVSRMAQASQKPGATTWNLGDKAAHNKWGTGTVVSVKGEAGSVELDIAFPSPTGIKRLLAEFAPITKV